MDAEGYSYYSDSLDRGQDPTYDMPSYSFELWTSVCTLQRKARIIVEANRERRRLKAEAKAKEMAIIEERWMAELRKGKRGAKLTISLDSLKLQVGD